MNQQSQLPVASMQSAAAQRPRQETIRRRRYQLRSVVSHGLYPTPPCCHAAGVVSMHGLASERPSPGQRQVEPAALVCDFTGRGASADACQCLGRLDVTYYSTVLLQHGRLLVGCWGSMYAVYVRRRRNVVQLSCGTNPQHVAVALILSLILMLVV